jgi:hypothetical protein
LFDKREQFFKDKSYVHTHILQLLKVEDPNLLYVIHFTTKLKKTKVIFKVDSKNIVDNTEFKEEDKPEKESIL